MKTATYQAIDEQQNELIISVDNTTDFKDFVIEYNIHKTVIQIDKTTNSLKIENCILSGPALELFKQFLNQL